jgi:hypothetical protein
MATTTTTTPTAEQVAEQFNVQPLEDRLEFLMPYGRDREQPMPTVNDGY